jgi:hypothetical protein
MTDLDPIPWNARAGGKRTRVNAATYIEAKQVAGRELRVPWETVEVEVVREKSRKVVAAE